MKILFAEDKSYYLALMPEIISNNEFYCVFNATKFLSFGQYKRILEFDLFIYFDDISSEVKFTTKIAKCMGLPVILVVDGVLEYSNIFYNKKFKYSYGLYHPCIADLVLTSNSTDKVFFEKRGFKSMIFQNRRIYPIGNVKNDVEKNKYLLITTANTPYFNSDEFCALIFLLKKLIENLKHNMIDYRFRIFDEKIINALGVTSDVNLINGSFQECARNSLAVISTPSSILYTSIMLDIPTCCIQYRNTPVFMNMAWNLSNEYHIQSLLESMTSREYERMNYQRSIIDEIELKNGEELKIEFEMLIDKKEKAIDFSFLERSVLCSFYNVNIFHIARWLYKKSKVFKFF